MSNNIKDHLLASLESLSIGGSSIGVDFTDEGVAWVNSSYPDAWVDEYVEHDYMSDDPTILHGLRTSGHFTWNDLNKLYPQNRVLENARRFGMSEGNTIAVHIEGAISIASCAGPVWTTEKIRTAKGIVSALHYLFCDDHDHPVISDGAKNVLKLMIAGYRDDDIAKKLGIKIESVRQRRYTAMEKLDAQTQSHLISKVIKFGIV